MATYVQIGSRILKYEGMDDATVLKLASQFGAPTIITQDAYNTALTAMAAKNPVIKGA